MKRLNNTIIQRVLNGVATPKQAEEVAEWISSDEGLAYIDKDYDAEAQYLLSKLKHRPMRKYALVYACAFSFALVLSAFAYVFGRYSVNDKSLSDCTKQMIETRPGQITVLAFPDGSKITLNGKSKVVFPSQFDQHVREIDFNGEGVFDISTDKTKPFIINLVDQQVKVTGTKFNLKAYSDDKYLEISLVEGAVSLIDRQEEYQIKENQNLRLEKETGAVSIKSISNAEQELLWTKRYLYYTDVPLADILKELSRLYGAEFDIESTVDTTERLSFRAFDDSLEDLLNDIAKITGLGITTNKHLVKISAK